MTTREDFKRTANPRRNKLLAAAVTVAILAVVLFAAGSLTPIKLPPRAASNSAISTQFVQRGEEALKSGDTTLAAQMARQAIKANPANSAAKQLQTKVNTAKKDAETNGDQSDGDNASGGTGDNAGDSENGTGEVVNNNYFAADPGAFANRGVDMEQLVPKKILGYEFTGAWQADGEIQKTALSTDPRGTVENMIWTVREMKSSDKAKSFIEKTSKQLYKHNAKPAQVDGVNAYFGTDGERYATCVYVRGVYVFELLATSRGVKPAEIRADAINAARAFTDTVAE